ncbi:hypothetical protein BMS3Abin15_00366 [bacterium BMS3Abin15]|nr:hypothetical protein BMS3Abin15_00366 [bacterium BMS3Abin15]
MNKKALAIISIAVLAAIVAILIIQSYYSSKIEDLSRSIPNNIKLQEKIGKDIDEWDDFGSNIVINSDFENLGNGYAINKETGIVYYRGNPMSGVDASTFEVLENGYARDKNTFYFEGEESEEDSDGNGSNNGTGSNNDDNHNSPSGSDVSESASHTVICQEGEGVSKFGIGERDRPTFTVCELGECGECNF